MILTKVSLLGTVYEAIWAERDTQERRAISMTRQQYEALGRKGAGAPDHAAQLPPGRWQWQHAHARLDFDTATGLLGENEYYERGDGTLRVRDADRDIIVADEGEDVTISGAAYRSVAGVLVAR